MYKKIKFLLLLIPIILLIGIGARENNFDTNVNVELEASTENNSLPIEVHSIGLGTNGDCTLIKVGAVDILIDVGGNKASSSLVYNALSTLVDGDLEYCILSHGDSDHIINFYNSDGLPRWINNGHKIINLIDFDIKATAKDCIGFKTNNVSISLKNFPCYNNMYKKVAFNSKDNENGEELEKPLNPSGDNKKLPYDLYVDKRNELVRQKKIVNYAPAYLLSKKDDNFRVEIKTGTSKNIYLELLYNYYFDHSLTKTKLPTNADYNLLSVCTMIEYDGEKFLFNGDLEEYDSSKNYKRIFGESYLIDNNPKAFNENNFLFYKASHHGSNTSNSNIFMDAIRPEYIFIPVTASSSGRFKFPRQNALNAMTKYTDYIYMNERMDGDKVINYHAVEKDGYKDITFSYNPINKEVLVNGIKPKSIFSDEWYCFERQFVTSIYNLCNKDRMNNTSINAHTAECTYIKIGHIDILVNAGITDSKYIAAFTDQIRKLCNDGILDLVILSSCDDESISDFISTNGIFDDLKGINKNTNRITSISNLLYTPHTWYTIETEAYDKYKGFCDELNTLTSNRLIGNLIPIDSMKENRTISVYKSNIYNVDIDVLYSRFDSFNSNIRYDNSISFILNQSIKNLRTNTIRTINYLNVGHTYNSNSLYKIENGVENNGTLFNMNTSLLAKKIDYFHVPYHGYSKDSRQVDYYQFLKKIAKPTGLSLLFNATLGSQNCNGDYIEVCPRFLDTAYDSYCNMILNNGIVDEALGRYRVNCMFGNFSHDRELGASSNIKSENSNYYNPHSLKMDSEYLDFSIPHRIEEYWNPKN